MNVKIVPFTYFRQCCDFAILFQVVSKEKLKRRIWYLPWSAPYSNSSAPSANNWARVRRTRRDNAPSNLSVVLPVSSCQVDPASDPNCSNISLFVLLRSIGTRRSSSRRPEPSQFQLLPRRSPRKPFLLSSLPFPRWTVAAS